MTPSSSKMWSLHRTQGDSLRHRRARSDAGLAPGTGTRRGRAHLLSEVPAGGGQRPHHPCRRHRPAAASAPIGAAMPAPGSSCSCGSTDAWWCGTGPASCSASRHRLRRSSCARDGVGPVLRGAHSELGPERLFVEEVPWSHFDDCETSRPRGSSLERLLRVTTGRRSGPDTQR